MGGRAATSIRDIRTTFTHTHVRAAAGVGQYGGFYGKIC
jgi:hypothetical protein